MEIPCTEPVKRRVYRYGKANWDQLRGSLLAYDWTQHMDGSSDQAAIGITSAILRIVSENIPSCWITDKIYAHPWLNQECQLALERKNAAEGTADFIRLRDACSQTFLKARGEYVAKTKGILKSMSPSSRSWWKLSGSLLARAGTRENIPPLQRPDDSWALTAEEKAEELSRVFKSKSLLPPAVSNEYSPLPARATDGMRLGFLRLRVRHVLKILENLDESSGTGPDLLPARILKRLASALALPVTLLARKLLRDRRWPACWREHWINAIFKKGERALGKNYRGVHLTPQLSKVVERAIATLFVPWMEANGSFGPHQYAYTKGMGYKDTLAVNVCNWILLLELGFLVGVYCSDVSGAFDRVSRDRLLDKLVTLGLHEDVLGFLASWLEDRSSRVVLGGKFSAAEILANSVFQGTVLGPRLWNVFYADSRTPLVKSGFTEMAFADDLNCWKAFRKVHCPVAIEGGWRLQTLLRSRRFFSTKELINLYKAQVLSYMESSTPGLYHAAPSVLGRVDRVQRRLLRELELSELEALQTHNLAPLASRRDIAMLGALHKVTLGTAPAQLALLFPLRGIVAERENRMLRYWRPLHNKQLATAAKFSSSDIMKRSLFGLCLCYNKLPQQLVDCKTVSLFQKTLQKGLLKYAERRAVHGNDWERLYSVNWRTLQRTQLDELFCL